MIASGQSFSLYQNKHVSVTKGLSSTLYAKKLTLLDEIMDITKNNVQIQIDLTPKRVHASK